MSQKTDNLKQNLRSQIEAIRKRDNTKGEATKDRYFDGACRACDFFAENFSVQKFANLQAKHFRALAEYLKTTKSPNTVYTELAALRHYIRLSGNKNRMPTNKELNLTKREPIKYNRAWLPHEIEKAIEVTKLFGLRISEVCMLKVQNLKFALGYGGPEIKGKGGQIRHIPIETDEQFELLKRLYKEARAKGLMDGDFIISKTIKYGPLREKSSLENWMTNNRHKFVDPERTKFVENGKKPRVEMPTWHGLRHYYTQERDKRLQGDPRRRQKLSEGLGHHRLSVTEIYKD